MAESAEHATSDLSTGGADDSGRVVDGAAVGGAETETKAEAEQHHDTGAVALRLASSDADPPAVDDDGEEESKGEAVAFDVPLDECPVCFDEPARTVQLACGHAFCLEVRPLSVRASLPCRLAAPSPHTPPVRCVRFCSAPAPPWTPS